MSILPHGSRHHLMSDIPYGTVLPMPQLLARDKWIAPPRSAYTPTNEMHGSRDWVMPFQRHTLETRTLSLAESITKETSLYLSTANSNIDTTDSADSDPVHPFNRTE
jgi:hypothetical protein